MKESRLIDADKLFETIKTHEYLLSQRHNATDYGMFTLGIKEAIDIQPTVEERKHGHWVWEKNKICAMCSHCGQGSYDEGMYCSSCGAIMDEVIDDDN